jgi:hypothetical protein
MSFLFLCSCLPCAIESITSANIGAGSLPLDEYNAAVGVCNLVMELPSWPR